MKCAILKSVYEQCKKSVFGAETGELFKICHNKDALLVALDKMQDEGLIVIEKEIRSKGIGEYNKLESAAHIKMTNLGERFLVSECEQV